jgi:hypothetical protein
VTRFWCDGCGLLERGENRAALVGTQHIRNWLGCGGKTAFNAMPIAKLGRQDEATLINDISRQEICNVCGSEDPNRKIVYWAYRSIANTLENSYDKVLLCHLRRRPLVAAEAQQDHDWSDRGDYTRVHARRPVVARYPARSEASRMARAKAMGYSDDVFWRGEATGKLLNEYPSGAFFLARERLSRRVRAERRPA